MPKKRKLNTNVNLNTLVSRAAVLGEDQKDDKNDSTVVHFENILEALLAHIEELQPDAIVGCMYWFTELRLLQRLAAIQIPVQIIVQKQKIWSRKKSQTNWIREAYNRLTPLDENVPAVRCLGSCASKTSKTTTSLMHHKFLVFIKAQVPVAVFTGSFNMSSNASRNLENALFLRNPHVARLYWQEWMQLLPFSESLDWKQKIVQSTH